jgi:hypothetical protein
VVDHGPLMMPRPRVGLAGWQISGFGGPRGERLGGKPSVYGRGKSDRPVVPAKPPNKPDGSGAEVVEERGLPEGNAVSEARSALSGGIRVARCWLGMRGWLRAITLGRSPVR